MPRPRSTAQPPPPPSVGEALRAVRKALDLNQEELAGLLGSSLRTILRWEHDQAEVSALMRPYMLKKLAQAPAPLVSALALALRQPDPHAAIPAKEEPSARPQDAARRLGVALEDLVLASADEHDVSPRRLRAFLAAALREIEHQGASAAAARAVLRLPSTDPAIGPKRSD